MVSFQVDNHNVLDLCNFVNSLLSLVSSLPIPHLSRRPLGENGSCSRSLAFFRHRSPPTLRLASGFLELCRPSRLSAARWTLLAGLLRAGEWFGSCIHMHTKAGDLLRISLGIVGGAHAGWAPGGPPRNTMSPYGWFSRVALQQGHTPTHPFSSAPLRSPTQTRGRPCSCPVANERHTTEAAVAT